MDQLFEDIDQLVSEMEIVEMIRSWYKPDNRYIQSVERISKNPFTLRGEFLVEGSSHLLGKLKHLAISETVLCVNQLERVAIAEFVAQGYVEEWGSLDPIKWSNSELGDEGLVIVQETVTFKDVIKPGKFTGILVLQEERKSSRGNYHLRFSFDFDHGKHVGEVRVCFIPGKAEGVNLEMLK